VGHWRKQAISFFVTSDCQFNCLYCYTAKLTKLIAPEDRVIDVDFAVAGMRDYFAWAKVPFIRYFAAGEPTVAWQTMAEIRRQGHKLAGDALRVELQTNGDFNETVAEWAWDNVNILWISIDGPASINDVQRPRCGGQESTTNVMKNVERFANHPTMQFGVRMTIVPENFHRQVELLEYFHDKGVQWICGAPTYSSPANTRIREPMLVDFARTFVPAFFKAREMGMFYQTHLMVNFDEPSHVYCRACTTPVCPQLTTDGYVSACDWASFGSSYLPGPFGDLIFGRWDRENKRIVYYEDKRKRLEERNVAVLAEGDCKRCEMLQNCAGGCIAGMMSRSGNLYKMDPNWCEATKYLGRHLPRNQGLFPVNHS